MVPHICSTENQLSYSFSSIVSLIFEISKDSWLHGFYRCKRPQNNRFLEVFQTPACQFKEYSKTIISDDQSFGFCCCPADFKNAKYHNTICKLFRVFSMNPNFAMRNNKFIFLKGLPLYPYKIVSC